VVELCRAGRHDDVKRALFEKWLRIGLLSFGRPRTPGNRYAIEHGIKKRDSGECMKDFIEDIRPSVHAAGLRFPGAATLKMELPEGIFEQ
jgi:1,2-phenylacetyl-CoA epoxidase catalytic subunit